MSRWGVQVTLGDQVLQHIDQGSAGVSTGVKVDHVVGAPELKERLRLWSREIDTNNKTQFQKSQNKNKVKAKRQTVTLTPYWPFFHICKP